MGEAFAPTVSARPHRKGGYAARAGINRTGVCYVRMMSHSATFAKLFKVWCALGNPVEFAVKHLENPLAVREIEIFVKIKTSSTFVVTWGRRTIHTSPPLLRVLAPRGARL